VAAGSPALRDKLFSLVDDPDLRVRYQLAFTLGEFSDARKATALAKLLTRDGEDSWIRLAVLSSLASGAGEVFQALVPAAVDGNDVATLSLSELTTQIGFAARESDVLGVVGSVEGLPDKAKPIGQKLIVALMDGLTRSRSPLRDRLLAADGKPQKLLAESLTSARKLAADREKPAGERAAAIRMLRMGPYASSRTLLPEFLGTREPQEVQSATLELMGTFNEPEIATVILEAWPTFSPRLRTIGTEVIFSRPEWLLSFLGKVDEDEIPLSDIEPARVRLLASHANPQVREQASKLVERLKLGRRQDVLDAYKPALSLAGDSAKGKAHFQKVCAVCHRLENVGTEIGPNLATVQNRGADAILLNVLDPNREVNPQFVNYLLVTTQGKSMTGLIAAETATSVTLKRQENATDTVLRTNIEELRSSGQSIMPEGLEKQLDPQALADVIAYLLSVK
jgi:putative heme-binding domain-containing protein